ncbi:Putative serine protease HtrA [Anatilimnocola aggregata]|uniref:Serine protease HtrA n=1 Tax=Anatilimnocola aggregata TaxID=2528021 RepID=A0A517YHC0_9BACT|nr:trypsin-like peptidase domain-containing protein [Anatilimnocola aggregata]QDU29615.1 Putative serine protease HtrA [Anatilimnocola aggregata]
MNRTPSLRIALGCLTAALTASSMLAAQETAADAKAQQLKIAQGTLLAPKAFRAAAKKVLPSLVTIESIGGLSSGISAAGIQAPGEGPTSGVIISPDGYIVTSTFNFIRKPPIITVTLSTGERKVAQLLGRDETRKICVLKVEGVNNLPVAAWSDRKDLRVGQWTVALGTGFGGNEPSLTAGIISATSRIGAKAIQTDANLSPANYGGPLIDLDGRVIGICVPLNPQSRDEGSGVDWYDSGIGFAVPLAGNDKVLEALKAGKTLQPAFLGVQSEPKGTPPVGATVMKVVPKSPAEIAGIKEGDRLQAIDGTEILDVTHLQSVIARYNAGDKAQINIQRGDEKLDLTAEFGVPPTQAKPPVKTPAKLIPGKQPEKKPE